MTNARTSSTARRIVAASAIGVLSVGAAASSSVLAMFFILARPSEHGARVSGLPRGAEGRIDSLPTYVRCSEAPQFAVAGSTTAWSDASVTESRAS